ncbi:MAG: hypothetical protein SPG45_05350 [Lactobacillus johnsonii]|nr:hypothetical protein [Lactobacillus johnsonii]MDY5419459.1 hypothetical protein [Lactobacillus johnsonii]
MAYKVIKAFTDSNLNSANSLGEKHIYWEGDAYPFKPYAGASTKLRLAELTSGGYIKEIDNDGRVSTEN